MGLLEGDNEWDQCPGLASSRAQIMVARTCFERAEPRLRLEAQARASPLLEVLSRAETLLVLGSLESLEIA